jgi:hypothetical protein
MSCLLSGRRRSYLDADSWIELIHRNNVRFLWMPMETTDHGYAKLETTSSQTKAAAE